MITGEELMRRGYRRVLRDESYCLLTPDNVRLKRDSLVDFSDGETVDAAELAERLTSYRPKPSMRHILMAAKRQHRRECRKCQNKR